MSHSSQSDSKLPVGPMKALLIMALAVFLLSTVAAQAVGLPTPAVRGTQEAVDPTSSNPDPWSSASPADSSPLPTAEPTVSTPSEPAPPSTTAASSTAPASSEPANAPTGQLSYTIQTGDTLAAIAQHYGVSIEELVAANGIADPDILYAGQTLVIPDGRSAARNEPNPPIATEVQTEPTPIPPSTSPTGIDEDRWIDVDLSDQRLTAYEGDTPVRSFLVSTGLPATPTPVGQFRIWIKLRYDDMAGADYYIEDVPFVMYFHAGYGLHGVTWHGNFGHPMSHGCVNLPTQEAEWLFGFAEVGTLVNVHE